MSTITSPSRISKHPESSKHDSSDKSGGGGGGVVPAVNKSDMKLESRLNTKDLEALQDAFLAEGDGYDNRLSLTRDQFCEALSLILNKGSKQEYADLFDKIDVTKEGVVDWDKFASHMLLEFYEKDDRVKGATVPQWKNLKTLQSPHKEIIQRVHFLKNTNRYISISKEGCVSMWGQNLKLQRSIKAGTDSCRARDLWITHFVHLHNINKIALAFTSKEIAIYDLSSKLEFNCQYKLQGLSHTPLSLDYWANPNNVNEAILTWGDTGGKVNALHFTSANIALFERPSAPAGEKQEPCLNVKLENVIKRNYKNARYSKHAGHSEWVRLVKYSPHLECFISCATTWTDSLVIGWMEKGGGASMTMKTTVFQISQGVNAFDYHEQLNLIATAGVNHHVCLWNPYVVSKPNGVLRGHMASVLQCQFNKPRGQLISFSKDKVLRIWDVQLQVCIQRLAGMFPKGPEVRSTLFFDERTNRLFITFNYQLTVMEMKPEIKGRVMTHDRPLVAAIYNSTYNQVVSACQGGNVIVWMADSGQKVKQFTKTHGAAELTCLAQDYSETRLFTGSTDGTVKVWDFNGHNYHTLQCGQDGQPSEVGQILVLKHSILVVGWSKYITVFRSAALREFHVLPSEWKGGQEHTDDILALSFLPPNSLASASYDGEIVLWNNNSEQASRHLTQRCRKQTPGASRGGKTFITATRENTEATEGGFDSRSYKQERPSTRPKSRAASRISMGSNDENNEFGFAIARMLFLTARKSSVAATSGAAGTAGANLVTCGGNGWVRWWNPILNVLLAEYVAHEHVGSIIMAVEKNNEYMVTGDVDGLLKVWNISEYCVTRPEGELPLRTLPPLVSQFQPHLDMINSLEMLEKNDRLLILSSSADCSVALWDIYGNQIGVFGQEDHWKVEPVAPVTEAEKENDEPRVESTEPEIVKESDGEDEGIGETISDGTWEPDDAATDDPDNHRINTWDQTVLGKEYQELRVQKRERRQPGTIPDLPYLHWEKTGAPPAGPFAALTTSMLDDVDTLHKPDFMANPHRYFAERSDSGDQNTRFPALAERESSSLADSKVMQRLSFGLKAAFDEKTLFPSSMLQFEANMKAHHAKILDNTQKKVGTNFLKNVKVESSQATARSSASPKKARRLKPLKGHD